jgi:hypothetical protein
MPEYRERAVPPTSCVDCMPQEWVGADGRRVTLQIERTPFLSIPAGRLSEAELLHSQGLFRPDCEQYRLSLRVALALEEMVRAAEASRGHVVAALVDGRAIQVRAGLFGGETLTLTFTEEQQAVDVAASLGVSPALREGKDGGLAEARRSQRALLDEIFSDPEQLQRLAAETGIAAEDLDKEALLSRLLCP